MVSPLSVAIEQEDRHGKDTSSGRFLAGNKFSRGRQPGSKPKLSEKFITVLGKHFERHGAKAVERLFAENVGLYLKLVAQMVPKEMIAHVEVNHSLELRAEVLAFVESYKRCQAMIGVNVEDATVIEDGEGSN